jgi:hypothetical protein
MRTSKARVLQLMREAQLLAPSRMFLMAENLHTRTIITARLNEVSASDHTLTATVEEGQVTVFVAVDRCATELRGPARGQESCALRGAGTAAAGSARLLRRASATGTITAAST